MHFPEQSRRGRQYQRFEEWHYNDAYDEVMAKYYQLIYAVDVAIGMIREAVETAGVKHKTLIIFYFDNGHIPAELMDMSKVLPYEESSQQFLLSMTHALKKKLVAATLRLAT